MLMGIHPRNNGDATLPFRQASSQGDDALKKYVAHHYQGVGWKSDFVLQEMIDSEDFYASEITSSLYNERFVLFGEAGYAAEYTGGGTSLALAGAYMLVGEISKHTGDLAAGLRGYKHQMRPIIKELQKTSPFIPTILAPQTAWGICLRNYAFVLLLGRGSHHLFRHTLVSPLLALRHSRFRSITGLPKGWRD